MLQAICTKLDLSLVSKNIVKMSSSPKKRCLVIGTHNGHFHCDEVTACWMLKQLPKYKDAEILRTRDNHKLSQCDIVVDVGGVYNADELRFDHHQRSFNGTMKSLGNMKWDTKLSSAGLIYLHFGKEVISQLIDVPVHDLIVSKLYGKVYEKFIEGIDGIDNGIDQYDGEARYQITTDLSSRISGLNPAWNDSNPDPDASFQKAMVACGLEFMDRINYYKNSWLPARKLVEEAVNQRHDVHGSGEIIALKHSGCPWKEHLFDIEEEKHLKTTIKFILYQDQNLNWRVQCVPKRLGSFENRLSLCSSWCGLRDEPLSTIVGVRDCIFVHANGFIGGNKTYDGVLEMAKKTLEAREE